MVVVLYLMKGLKYCPLPVYTGNTNIARYGQKTILILPKWPRWNIIADIADSETKKPMMNANTKISSFNLVDNNQMPHH